MWVPCCLQLMLESMRHVKRNTGTAEMVNGGDSRKEKTAFDRVLYGAPSADIFFDVFFNKGKATNRTQSYHDGKNA